MFSGIGLPWLSVKNSFIIAIQKHFLGIFATAEAGAQAYKAKRDAARLLEQTVPYVEYEKAMDELCEYKNIVAQLEEENEKLKYEMETVRRAFKILGKEE